MRELRPIVSSFITLIINQLLLGLGLGLEREYYQWTDMKGQVNKVAFVSFETNITSLAGGTSFCIAVYFTSKCHMVEVIDRVYPCCLSTGQKILLQGQPLS